jgi:DNA-directed RNA polymerase specialized sigma24 family protein
MSSPESTRDRIRRFEADILVHLDDLYRAARRLTGNAAEVQDLTQDTCLRALRPIQETPLGEVREALARLPLPFREPLVLAHVGGFSYKEIAAILAIPLGTVMSRLFRGRRLLRSELREPTRRSRSSS